MTVYNLHKAEGTPTASLVFTHDLPEAASLHAGAMRMDHEAYVIAEVLYTTLPAGVLDRLAAHLLLLVASQLRPTYPQRNGEAQP
jgi:hypothetical protein